MDAAFIQNLRHLIATNISSAKSYAVPGICSKYGLTTGSEREAFSGKYPYVSKRLHALTPDQTIEIARLVQQDYASDELGKALSSMSSPSPPPTRAKQYYSIRTGTNPLAGALDLTSVLELFKHDFEHLEDEGYFQEALGLWCIDSGEIAGSLGHLQTAIFLALRKKHLLPIRTNIPDYAEDDFFDVIEFLYDNCSKPIEREYHNHSQCGWHCSSFIREPGRREFREKVNKILALYKKGYELSEDGEILSLPDQGFDGLFEAPLPAADKDNVEARVKIAQEKFRRSRSLLTDRRDAIRELADVLEYLRPSLKSVLIKKDDAAIFEIANNFAIRHHNQDQKTEYDKPIWYSWMFYFYLATIHAGVRLIEQKTKKANENSPR